MASVSQYQPSSQTSGSCPGATKPRRSAANRSSLGGGVRSRRTGFRLPLAQRWSPRRRRGSRRTRDRAARPRARAQRNGRTRGRARRQVRRRAPDHGRDVARERLQVRATAGRSLYRPSRAGDAAWPRAQHRANRQRCPIGDAIEIDEPVAAAGGSTTKRRCFSIDAGHDRGTGGAGSTYRERRAGGQSEWVSPSHSSLCISSRRDAVRSNILAFLPYW